MGFATDANQEKLISAMQDRNLEVTVDTYQVPATNETWKVVETTKDADTGDAISVVTTIYNQPISQARPS